MTTLRQRVVALLTAVTAVLALTSCSGGSTPTANGSIDVLSWWTSTSESSALNVLVDSYEKQNPGTSVDEIAVVGGGGSQAHVVLATRIAHGDPPDVWQNCHIVRVILIAFALGSWIAGGVFAESYDVDSGFRPIKDGFSFVNYGEVGCSDPLCFREFPIVNLGVDVKLCEATSLMDNKLKNERLAIERKLLIPCIVLS